MSTVLRTVLIAEDNRINRRLLRSILEHEYEVLEAVDGEETMALLREKHETISALILDISMPVMDGYEVLRRIQGDMLLSQIPVIVSTSMYEESVEVKALSLGARDFVTKPFNPALIMHCLRNAINLRETATLVNALQRDKLTGLYTREAFFEKARLLLREREEGFYVMASLDIDNFKLINDQFGVAEGDRLLQHLGEALWTGFKELGGICARISADNFAALYPSDDETLKAVALMRETRLIPPDTRAAVVFSVGRYKVTDLSLSASAIYDRAYIAKRSVKGRYDEHVAWFDDSMREKLIREQEIINDMDVAISEKQFEVWFQPQFNHTTGALIGAEALVRWRHPKRGLIPPCDFIPLFEHCGFIYQLDKYVWEQVCRYLRRWLDEGRRPLPVSINISRYDIFRPDMLEVITGLVERYGLSNDLLRLEITESAFSRSSEQIISVVKQLKRCGFVVEIDDFGSGYSSLNILKDVPADTLKLDMLFFERTENSRRSGNILESVIRMAKWLNMSVIAEGVETSAQAEFLESIGCSYIQGYLYSKPISAEDYELMAENIGKEERLLAMESVENLDNNRFWDPDSMDTLVFNSFLGGACIFEYHRDKVEILRANKKYTRGIGLPEMSVEDALKINWIEHFEPRDAERLKQALFRSLRTGEEVTEEYALINLPGCRTKTYLRSTMKVIATAGERLLVYCTDENMTAQRQAEEKERAASERMQAIMDDVGSGITATVYVSGRLRFLLANDRFYEIMGYTREQYEDERRDPFSGIYSKDKKYVMKTVREVRRNSTGSSIEYRIVNRKGELRWVRAVLSTTHFDDVKEDVQLCVFNDITAEKLREQELRETDEQLRFLNETSHELLAQPDAEKAIESTLQRIMDYFGGARVYISEFDYAGGHIRNSYEVCAPHTESRRSALQNAPISEADFWVRAFDEKKYVVLGMAGGTEKERAASEKLLRMRNTGSLIAVPLRRDGRLLGFLGVDEPSRQHMHIGRLAALGDFVSVMLTRRDLGAKISDDSRSGRE